MYKTENQHASKHKIKFLWRWWNLTVFLNTVLHCQNQTNNNKKKILWFLDVCTWCSLVCRLAFTCPVLFKWNWRPIRMDGTVDSCDFSREKKSLDWRRFLGKIFTACFLQGYTPGLSAPLCACVCAGAWSDQFMKDWRWYRNRNIDCCGVTGPYSVYMWSLNPTSVV